MKKKLLGIVVVFALGFVAGVAWYRDSGESLIEGEDPAITEPLTEGVFERVVFSDVGVQQDERGHFAGSITLSNKTDRSMPVLVSVHVYDGPDNIADLTESTTLKPRTTSTVHLTSYTDYAEFTDTTVKLLPLG